MSWSLPVQHHATDEWLSQLPEQQQQYVLEDSSCDADHGEMTNSAHFMCVQLNISARASASRATQQGSTCLGRAAAQSSEDL